MLCFSCHKEIPDDALCCCYCAAKIPDVRNLGAKYRSTYGTWKVTTEGDCEGKTTIQLGTFTGHIDDLARKLTHGPGYSFHFEAIEPKEKEDPLAANRDRVSISLDIDSKTWDMNHSERVNVMKELFKDRPVEITDSNYYASFVLIFKRRNDE